MKRENVTTDIGFQCTVLLDGVYYALILYTTVFIETEQK